MTVTFVTLSPCGLGNRFPRGTQGNPRNLSIGDAFFFGVTNGECDAVGDTACQDGYLVLENDHFRLGFDICLLHFLRIFSGDYFWRIFFPFTMTMPFREASTRCPERL